jgi:hypothetical protein
MRRMSSSLERLSISICVLYLRVRLLEDVEQAAPRLEKVDVEFQELWHLLRVFAPRVSSHNDLGLVQFC